MLDKSLPYIDLIMKRPAGAALMEPRLPDGYSIRHFMPGDEIYWAEIEASVGEFNREMDALLYFQKTFLPCVKELERRCLFVCNPENVPVGTFTIWWAYTGKRRDPWVYWVAVRPEFQKQGLGKAAIASGMKLACEIEGDRDMYLHTQTWSWQAIRLYQEAGFCITDETGLGGHTNDNHQQALAVLKQYISL